MSTPRLTPRELDVMSILWERGDATAAEVHAALGQDLAYTSVLSQLRLLELKGHVSHAKQGRAHRFTPLLQPDAAGEGALERLLAKVYHGSPVKLLAHLVSGRRVSGQELQRMRDLLDERLAEDDR